MPTDHSEIKRFLIFNEKTSGTACLFKRVFNLIFSLRIYGNLLVQLKKLATQLVAHLVNDPHFFTNVY